MPITRKRKVRSPEQSKQTTSVASQKSISHYGRVTKSQKVGQGTRKCKALFGEALDLLPTPEIPDINLNVTAQTQPQPDLALQAATLPQQSTSTTTSTRKRRHEEPVETPQRKRFKNAIPPTPSATPSKSALRLFDRLSIETYDTAVPNNDNLSYETPPLTPRSSGHLSDSKSVVQLPPQLQDLVQLFSAFLASTSLYYAQNGPGSSLQLDFVLQNVTKTWKRRLVTETDIRAVLGVLGDSSFKIIDNGAGIIYLEQVDFASAGHFNQPELRRRFEKQLRSHWREWISVSAFRDQDSEAFIKQIPLATVHQGDFVDTKDPRTIKGQQRLDELKRTAPRNQPAGQSSPKSFVAPEAKTSAGVSSRGSSLLDRILAKEQLIYSQSNGPTQQEINRRIALNRIEDVIPVLDVLAGSRPRVSYSTPTLVLNLQNSLRNPISKEESERCLELMASEITPTFVSMIHSGQVKGVVITRGGRPANAELRLRLERAGA